MVEAIGHADGDLDPVVERLEPGVGAARFDGAWDVGAASPVFFDKLAISAAHASNRSVNPPPGLAHGTGNRPHPVHGTAEARAHLETDCNAQLLPALPRIPEIHGLDLPRRLQLQGGGEQVRGIHAPSTYPTGTTRQTYHPPQTAKGPYFHRFRQYQTIPH